MHKVYLVILFLLVLKLQAQNTYKVEIPTDRFQIDTIHKLILCNIDLAELPSLSRYDSIDIKLDALYRFSTNPKSFDHEQTYTVKLKETEYALYFSKFPLIAIRADQRIIDEPKRPATFVYTDFRKIQKSDVGIELRGATSQYFPKKTYDLEFWDDATGEKNKDMQFGDLREDDDWILDALYNEPLRLRSLSAHQLWLDMHEPYYQREEEKAKSGAGVMYVEVFLNAVYKGVYMLSEQVDKKQLKLKSFKNGKIRGELYKAEAVTSSTRFANALPYDNTKATWAGFELKHPDEDDRIDWSKPHDFVDFVAHASDLDFDTAIAKKVQIDNALDYFIFLNLLRAADNRGKNYYLGKYNQDDPYFFVPWDLDGTFGLKYDGSYYNVTHDILSNYLFDRLFKQTPTDEIQQKIYERWVELRAGVLSNERLLGRLDENYRLLENNKIYEREAMVWRNYPYDKNAKAYIEDWTTARLSFLDQYFAGFDLGIASINRKEQKLMIYPNPATTTLHVENNGERIMPYTIFTLQGQKIQHGNIASGLQHIDVARLNPGAYLFVMDGNTRKIFVAH